MDCQKLQKVVIGKAVWNQDKAYEHNPIPTPSPTSFWIGYAGSGAMYTHEIV